MMKLNWERDHATANAAVQFPLPLRAKAPAAQFAGFRFEPANWNHRVLPPGQWPDGPLISSPQQIIDLLVAGSYLEALAMVISWGGMWRQPNAIYGPRSLLGIQAALQASASSIQQTRSIVGAWAILTGNDQGQLGWSSVLTSKTLHFLSRALGFQQNPPVAIDNAVILDTVWPAWRHILPQSLVPEDWRGGTLQAYLRYMTAILVWADRRGWTTTQMEPTIFAEYGRNDPTKRTGHSDG